MGIWDFLGFDNIKPKRTLKVFFLLRFKGEYNIGALMIRIGFLGLF